MTPEEVVDEAFFEAGDRVVMFAWAGVHVKLNAHMTTMTPRDTMRVGTVVKPQRWSSGNWVPETLHYEMRWDDGERWPVMVEPDQITRLNESHAAILLAR